MFTIYLYICSKYICISVQSIFVYIYIQRHIDFKYIYYHLFSKYICTHSKYVVIYSKYICVCSKHICIYVENMFFGIARLYLWLEAILCRAIPDKNAPISFLNIFQNTRPYHTYIFLLCKFRANSIVHIVKNTSTSSQHSSYF